MKRDLKSMKFKKEDIKKAAELTGTRIDEQKLDEIDRVNKMMSQYEGKSENELMGELFRTVQQGKKDGSFDTRMLDDFYQKAAPLMQGDQKKRLDAIMRQLKSN